MIQAGTISTGSGCGAITISPDETRIAQLAPGGFARFREHTATFDRAVSVTPVGDGSLIAQQRAVFEGLQARVGELKAQGKTADEAATMLTAEFQTQHPDWTAANRIGGMVRSLYAEPSR